MNYDNTIIVVSRFNEDANFLEKINLKTIVYDKENPQNKYNIEKPL